MCLCVQDCPKRAPSDTAVVTASCEHVDDEIDTCDTNCMKMKKKKENCVLESKTEERKKVSVRTW